MMTWLCVYYEFYCKKVRIIAKVFPSGHLITVLIQIVHASIKYKYHCMDVLIFSYAAIISSILYYSVFLFLVLMMMG